MTYRNFEAHEVELTWFRKTPAVNMMPNCLRVLHIPTGTVVEESSDRLAHKNKHRALTRLDEILGGLK